MSFYTSLNGLKNAQTDLGVISHNIANSETTGFKKGRAEFADLVAGQSFTSPFQGIGATVESVRQSFALGPVELTGNTLDFAINGEGFFTTRSAKTGETFFTRNGSFTTDTNGYVFDGSGYRMQLFPAGAGGAISSTTPQDARLPATSTTGSDFASAAMNADGQLIATFADGSSQVVGTVALATFSSVQGLIQAGSSNWEASGVSGAPKYGAPGTANYGSILSGALERSNVDIAEELVGLITAQRNFQANAKALDTATQISQTIINLRT